MTVRSVVGSILGIGLGVAACGSSTTTPPATDAGSEAAVDVVEVVDTPPAVDTGMPVQASGIGSACESEGAPFPPQQGTCRTGQLCLSGALGFAGGYCTRVCTGGGGCGPDAVCGRLQGFPICFQRCTTNADCRTAQGYVCGTAEGVQGVRVCRINDEPVGTRDGAACFTPGASGTNVIPALPRVVFQGANASVSAARNDSFIEAEGNIAVSPTNGAVANSYIALGGGNAVFMGVSRSADGMAWTQDGRVTDPDFNGSSDPVLEYSRDGTLRMTFIGLARNGVGQVTNVRVRVTESSNNGMTWATPRPVDPAGTCVMGGICDKPWLTAGPGVEAGTEALYLGYLAQTQNAANLLVQRSDDAAQTWSRPVVLASAGQLGTTVVAHNLIQFATGPSGRAVAAWAGIAAGQGAGEGSSARLGSPSNRVLMRGSRDGFRTLEPLRIVSRPTDSPVYIQPPVALDGDTVHVAYLTGDASGAWDLILATSTNGGESWQYRKVNDEPESCATHGFPAMLVDRETHAVHLIWMENRFGEGAVAYARCPGDASMPCGRNEAVSDAPFRFTTGRNPQAWHGDYLGLTLTGMGELWATWSDTRSGNPAMYVAHGRVRP